MYIMVNYQNSSIYKICCNDVSITDIYIGSTTNFTRRKQEHKKNTNGDFCNIYVYQFIRENNGWNNWNMIEIEKYEATDKKHLESRERYWIETLKSTLNKCIPTRTHKEYRDENKESAIKRSKKWYEEHKEQRAIDSKIYREENETKIKQDKKEYYEKNKEQISIDSKIKWELKTEEERKKKNNANYQKNKQNWKEYGKIKTTCICGCEVRNDSKSNHKKSRKHLNFLAQPTIKTKL